MPIWVAVVLVAMAVLVFWSVWSMASFERRFRALAFHDDDLGQLARALYAEYLVGYVPHDALEAAAKLSAERLSNYERNLLVCVEVAAGRYEQALAWRGRAPALDGEGEMELVLRINEAEALANLGRLEEALAWVSGGAASAYTVAALAGHNAWCLVALGKVQEAKQALANCDPSVLAEYSCEWYLTATAVSLAERDWPEAMAALKQAAACAQRASSKRNVVFMRGHLRFAQGRYDEAATHFEAGAAMTYIGQGGGALLEWGDALAVLGQRDAAGRAWSLCLERDPQSRWAREAAVRLS